MQEYLVSILWVMLVTLIPTLELRASIPAGILGLNIQKFGVHLQLTPLPAWLVFLTAVGVNILLGILVYETLGIIITLLERVSPRMHAWYKAYEEKLLRKHARYELLEWLGVAAFIAIPLPGSGVYSGSILARALILPRRDAYRAISLGTLIVGVIVLILTLTGKAYLT